MSTLPARIYVHHVHISCLRRGEEGVRSPGAEVRMVVSSHKGVGKQACVLLSNMCS